MGADYERELKGILSGDEDAVRGTTLTCSPEEARDYRRILAHPFLVVRGAGSLGVDLVALRDDFSFPLEVKSSTEPTITFSRNARMAEQAERMKGSCARAGVIPMYAFRLKGHRGDAWRLYTMELDRSLRGRMRVLYERIPKAAVSAAGNYILYFEKGLKMSAFLAFLDFLRSPLEATSSAELA